MTTDDPPLNILVGRFHEVPLQFLPLAFQLGYWTHSTWTSYFSYFRDEILKEISFLLRGERVELLQFKISL